MGGFASRVGITPANVAVLKNGRAKAVRLSTLEAICEVLDRQPGDLLEWVPDTTRQHHQPPTPAAPEDLRVHTRRKDAGQPAALSDRPSAWPRVECCHVRRLEDRGAGTRQR